MPKDYPYYTMNIFEWVQSRAGTEGNEHGVDENHLLSFFTSNV